jgi:hypothetical protein
MKGKTMNNEQSLFQITVTQKAIRYTRALSHWIKLGRPVRDEQEIVRIFTEICTKCESFDKGTSSCCHCGCRVNKSQIAPLNKIAMATEHCPLEKW